MLTSANPKPCTWSLSSSPLLGTTGLFSMSSEQQKFIVSLFWRLQVPIPGAGRAALSLRAAGENPSFLPLVRAGLPVFFGFQLSIVVSASDTT